MPRVGERDEALASVSHTCIGFPFVWGVKQRTAGVPLACRRALGAPALNLAPNL